MKIVRLKSSEVDEVAAMIRRNLMEINRKEYTESEMKKLLEANGIARIRYLCDHAHMYVAKYRGRIIACGGITAHWASQDTSRILSVFVMPEYHKKGVGRAMVKHLLADEYALITRKTEVFSARTATGFYQKMGFQLQQCRGREKELLHFMVLHRNKGGNHGTTIDTRWKSK